MYGPILRRARTSRGLTQRQLAAISGIEQANISAIENDRRAPSAETLHRLLTACGYELLGVAGNRVLAFPHPAVGPECSTDQPPDEAPTITPGTPLTDRVRAINAVLDLAETIVRSR